jgi:subtilisin family serine protease
MLRRFRTSLIIGSGAVVTAALSIVGQEPPPGSLESLLIEQPELVVVNSPLQGLTGEVAVVVRLKAAPLAAAAGPNARRLGARLTPAQQQAYLAQLRTGQDAVMTQVGALGGTEIARVSKALNAVIVSIDAAQLTAVQGISAVATIRPVVDYTLALNTTVPYVGASQLHAGGLDGTGVTIAVLDSGIDYTHRNLGGPGTTAAYTAAYGPAPSAPANQTRDGLFPTAKVVEGYDFVGEVWPNGPRALDPDPIDFEGHGTHVADIAAGRSSDGLHKGVAPGAKLLAVKVCSSVATSCSAIALLQGMDFALDPNGDGAIDDAADVINLSLGGAYGQREDDLSEASHIVTVFGTVVVAAAGNEGDRPYIVSSPASTPAVIAVAQTEVPTGVGFPLVVNAPPAIAGTYPNTEAVDWAPVGSGFGNAPVVYVGRGCPAGSVGGQPGEDPYLSNPAGKVALIDRGACNVSLKVDRAAKAGAIGVLIGLVAPGDAVGFAFAGGDTFVPTVVIQQSLSNSIKAPLGAGQVVLVTLSPLNAISLAMSVVGSSSRGPNYSYNGIKPDIAAPGGSVSAEVGTGTGETAFSGTSGAAPMVTGAVALLLAAQPLLSPTEIKAKLVNTAETNVLTNPRTVPGELAPISRIGGGELRVNRAHQTQTIAWDASDPASPNLGFGVWRSNAPSTLAKKILVRNYASVQRTYTISSSFRYANDAASGAVTLNHPPMITVPPYGSGAFVVSLGVTPSLLNLWTLNGGSRGGDGFRLQTHEFDGYVRIADATDTIRVPWHVLTHRAANPVVPTNLSLNGTGTGTVPITNAGGAVPAVVNSFWLTGTSPRFPASVLPRPGDNFAIVDLRAVGVRLLANALGPGQHAIQFAITTFGERSHPNYPAEFDVYLDTNSDGVDDFVVFTAENGGVGVSGQNVTALQNLSTNPQVVRFFTDADLWSSNAILTILASDAGLSATSQLTFTVFAGDNYYTGVLTDSIGPMTVKLDTPRFTAGDVAVPVNGLVNLGVTHNPAGDAASPSQTGLLLMYRDAKKGREADVVTIIP